MLSPLVSWILSASSSSSSTNSSEGEGLESSTANNAQVNPLNDNDDYIHRNHDNDKMDDPSTSSAENTIPSAVPSHDVSLPVTVAFPTPENQPNLAEPVINTTTIGVSCAQGRIVPWSNDSRRQPLRLWTKEDEVKLLEGYLDHVNANARWGLGKPNCSLQNDVASFYDDVKPKLKVDFNKNQLVEKLRRLKRKHSLMLDRIKSGEKRRPLRCPNDEAIFEISNKLWGDRMNSLNASSRQINVSVQIEKDGGEEGDEDVDDEMTRPAKRPRLISNEFEGFNDGLVSNENEDMNRIKGLLEETMRTCLSPMFKELITETLKEFGTASSTTMPLSLGEQSEQGKNCSGCGGTEDTDKWRGERIIELDLYSKKLEVVQDHIKAALLELRSIGSK